MTAPVTTNVATGILTRGRDLFAPALHAAVDRLDEHTRLVTSYHLGWCDAEGRPVESNPGKAVRPGLVLLASEAVCGSPGPGVPGAVAAELVHNFSLVHDDLMDRDTERRHRPTVWSVWGEATAVLVGDAMASLAHEVLSETESPYAQRAARALDLAVRELIRGQVLDVAFERRNDVRLAECLDMAAGKTGALLAVSAELGAILAGAAEPVAAAYRRYGAELGLAFQLVDDLLGIWGWPERTGKPVYSDLRARKKTMPVVWSIEYGGLAGKELARWLEDPREHGEPELEDAADLVERAGGRQWATDEARARVASAHLALQDVDIDPIRREQLEALARFVIERDL
ncbi:MAG: polyprenyl synthetase family protein [Marmoricola sp.]